MADDITSIPGARSQVLEPTGEMHRVWYRFLFNQFKLTGSGTTSNTINDIELLGLASSIPGETINTNNDLLLTAPSQIDLADMQRQLDNLLSTPVVQPVTSVDQLDALLLMPVTQPVPSISDKNGRVVLVAGTATVSTKSIANTSQVFLTHRIAGGTLGILSVGVVVEGTSFVINSTSALDTSTVNWFIVDPK